MAVNETSIEMASGRHVRIIAENVRRERTGVHAKIIIAVDETLLAYDVFNVERSQARRGLARDAFEGMSQLDTTSFTVGDLKHALDLFCHDLWDETMERFQTVEVNGNDAPPDAIWHMRMFLLKGGGTIVFAPPGRGKSYCAMLAAQSLNVGHSDLFEVYRPTKPLYVNLERSAESMQRRLIQVNRALGIDPNVALPMLHARGNSLYDISEGVRRAIDTHGIDVMFLDSISRAGYGDLIDNVQTNKIIDVLNNLCPTWWAIAHTPRQDDSHIYGSVHFEAGADIVVQTITEPKNGTLGIGLKVVKANDGAVGGVSSFVMEFDTNGLSGVRYPRRNEFLALTAATSAREAIDDACLHFIQRNGPSSPTDIATATGHPHKDVTRFMQQSPMFEFSRGEKNKPLFSIKEEQP